MTVEKKVILKRIIAAIVLVAILASSIGVTIAILVGRDGLTDSGINYNEFLDEIDTDATYRFVIRNSRLTGRVKADSEFKMSVFIENTGTENIADEKELILIFTHNGEFAFATRTDIDIREWNAGEIIGFSFSLTLPSDLTEGGYRVYFRIAPHNQPMYNVAETVRFANENTWNEILGANFMGEFIIR